MLAALLALSQVDGEEPIVLDDPTVFSCTPGRIEPLGSRTIELRKRDETLRELSVQRPGTDAPHFLVVAQAPAEMRPLMSPEEFASTARIEVDTASLVGLEWKHGARSELVFTEPGKYIFFASAVLGSGIGGYICSVTFSGSR
ncbi:MAG: hypothetical protein KDI71_10265 [Xanthomonadales bacterium]|nr:hypothetical protein [Xanthomonadales bacterium]